MKTWLKVRLIAGFFVTVPAFATAWILYAFWSWIDSRFAPIYERILRRPVEGWGLGFLTAVVLILLMGIVARMRAGGHVVNVGDGWARGAPAGWSAYAASKTGMETLTRVLAAELRSRAITVNCVAPGPVLKPERLPRARWRAITRGRAGRPADVVRAVVRFATCAPSLTGRVATIAGGRSGTTARRRRPGR